MGEGYDYCIECGADVSEYNNFEARAEAPQVFCMYCGAIIMESWDCCGECGTLLGETFPPQ